MIYNSAEKNEAGKKWKWVRGLEQRPRKPALCRERTNKEPQKEVECSAVFAATLSSTCTTIPDINRATKKNDGPQWMANLTWKRLLYYTDTHYVITFVCAVMILCLFFLSCEQLWKLCRPQRQHRKWLLVIKHMQHTQHLHKNDFLQSDCLMKKKWAQTLIHSQNYMNICSTGGMENLWNSKKNPFFVHLHTIKIAHNAISARRQRQEKNNIKCWTNGKQIGWLIAGV